MPKIPYAQQRSIMNEVLAFIKEYTPEDSGNLKLNGVTGVYLGNGKWRIYVDEEKAPYMKYTNENWNEFAPPLKGKQNPNEGWWHVVCQNAVRIVADRLKGNLKK